MRPYLLTLLSIPSGNFYTNSLSTPIPFLSSYSNFQEPLAPYTSILESSDFRRTRNGSAAHSEGTAGCKSLDFLNDKVFRTMESVKN